MNPRTNAVRVGLGRGWTEFKLSLRSPQDQGFYVIMAVAVLGYLYFRRSDVVEGTSLLVPSVAMPSIFGALVAFGMVIGPAYALAIEREDGTLLRAKAVPHGMLGYVSGQLLLQTIQVIPMFAIIVIPSLLLFDGLVHRGAASWLTVLWVLALGMLATLPLGMVIGSLVKSPPKVGTWGMLPTMVLAGISGIFYPVQELLRGVQIVAQIFPMYWIGLGMRSAFLPDAAAALEIGQSWRTVQTVAVLGAWAVAGVLVAPVVLRRMARRQSGAAVQEAREAAAQWVR